MATWSELAAYVRSNYRVMEEERDSYMRLAFNLSDGRSQVVVIAPDSFEDEEWASVESGIADAAEVNLDEALAAAGAAICGGLIIRGTTLVFRHSFPLANLDANEFEGPLGVVLSAADELERVFTGRDDY